MNDTDEARTIRVLVVDDHAIVRSGLGQLLATTSDLQLVGEASDGDTAVTLTAELRPDVVLMDLSMPGTDGVAATRRIAQQTPDSRVLVLTSFSDRARITEAVAAGAEGYLLKHAEPEAILAGIRDLFAGGAPFDSTAARVLLSEQRARAEAAPELTQREREVLLMVREGLPNKSIARRLGISERTVKAHLTNTFQRLGVRDRTSAALWAERHL